MTIRKYRDGEALVIALSGRLDTETTRELEKEVRNSLDGVTELVFDFANLSYITSAGLRALLTAYRIMQQKKGTMRVTNSNEIVREVFEVTGFSGLLPVE